jgi:hypothetical protein
VKRKAARKTTKKSPTPPAKPLGEHFSGERPPHIPSRSLIRFLPDGTYTDTPRTEIEGVPLPPDLEQAVRYYTRHEFEFLEECLTRPPWTWAPPEEQESERDYPGWKEARISPDGWHEVRRTLEECFRRGFYLALLRYADDLKTSAEAEPLIEGLRQAARKGGAARRAQAAPTHRAIQKRFRELRKTVPKKTARYFRVADEFKMSDRQIARIVNGID